MGKNNLYVELTPELIKEAQRRWDIISNEGCTKNGVSESINPSVKPDWHVQKFHLNFIILK